MMRLELPYTFLRPSFFMQNLNTTHQMDIQKNQDLFIPAGKAKLVLLIHAILAKLPQFVS
ncbi:hypothetical protein [Listeria grandensis]|uniref:hypothetical protein n=1 Tax=Listeria grandensis TaxID=1494963 RepID=UPI0030C6B879